MPKRWRTKYTTNFITKNIDLRFQGARRTAMTSETPWPRCFGDGAARLDRLWDTAIRDS